MSVKSWLILISAATLTALLGIWYALTNIGGWLSNQFPASIVDQLGTSLSAIGNLALQTVIMFGSVALIVTVIILYIRERGNL